MSQITEALNWRAAIKQYDTDKKLNESQLDSLMQAITMAPTSFGLQAFKVINVVDSEIREKLKSAAWNQPQITDASHLFVFTVPTNLSVSDVDEFIENTAKTRNLEIETLKDYSEMIKSSVASRDDAANTNWSARQVYIALGFLLETAAIENIDATPMEGFDNAQFDEILGLKDKNLTSVVITALGFRSEEDTYSKMEKVRKTNEELFITI